MSTITRLNLWKDVGYTDGCMEVPPTTDALPEADLYFENLNPTKARMFSEIRVPEDYVALLDYSYLSIAYDNNNGTDKTFYGWIDSVEMISDTTSAPITAIHWHVDLWRTYLADAEFGSGIVRRKPYTSGDSYPPQQPSYRYKTVGTPTYISSSRYWVYVTLSATRQVGGQDYTYMEVRAIPVSGSDTGYFSGLYLSSTVRAMPMRDIFWGEWDEKWGIDPNNIISVFLAPHGPASYTGTGSSSSSPIALSTPWTLAGTDQNAYYTTVTTGQSFYYIFSEQFTSFTASVMTDDVTEYVVRGFSGETIGILPWGISVQGVESRIVYSPTASYVQLRFLPTGESDSTWDYTKANQLGLVFNIPLWVLDVTENSWSSYVYSSQRQYDMEQRNLNTESSAVSGGLSIGASALTGAASGAMLGSVVPVVGTLAGAAIGAIGGIISGAITTGGNYAYETNVKNDEMQRMEDYAHADQADGLLLSGNGMDCMVNGTRISIVPRTIDTYASTNYANDTAIYGMRVFEATSDCTSLITAGGPLQIENLIVNGDIPPSAKNYIKQRLSQGVIIS